MNEFDLNIVRTEGQMLTDSHMYEFKELLKVESCGVTQMQDPRYLYFLDEIDPIKDNDKHIQILFSGPYNCGHWIFSYYDGAKNLYIYDSLNKKCLNNDQRKFLNRLYPFEYNIFYPHVQQQPNFIDCGVYAIAFATSLYFNIRPDQMKYKHLLMRRHLYGIFKNKCLSHFPILEDNNLEKRVNDNVKNEVKVQKPYTETVQKDTLSVNINSECRYRERHVENCELNNYKDDVEVTHMYNMNMEKSNLQCKKYLHCKLELKKKMNPEIDLGSMEVVNLNRKRKSGKEYQREYRERMKLKKKLVIDEGKKNNDQVVKVKKVKKSRADSQRMYRERLKLTEKMIDEKESKIAELVKTEEINKLKMEKVVEMEEIKRRKRNEYQRNYRERLKLKRKLLDENEVVHEINLNKISTKKTKLYDLNALKLQSNSIHLPVYKEDYLGEMSNVCKYCQARHFKEEEVTTYSNNSYNDCCSHGGVQLQLLDYTSELRTLLDGTHEKSAQFKRNIRSYNNSFAFASFNANILNINSKRRGPFCFKIQGQIYYQMNSVLYPESGHDPCYGQLFIYDPDESVKYRLNRSNSLDVDILRDIDNIMRVNNEFSKSYIMMKEVIELETQKAYKSNKEIPDLKLLFTLKKGLDPKRFNFQRVNEVAAIFNTNAEGEIPESYVTVFNKSKKELQMVNSLDPCVEPLIYPLLYLFGEKGYSVGSMRADKEKRLKKQTISRTAYLKYRMSIRNNEFNQILNSGRLFQQWLVDNYVKVEKDRLRFCADHQRELRSETYRGLVDHINNKAQNNDSSIGKIVVLPSTFIGSPRNMMQQYQDSMAIVAKHGKPDLFITMTCNPKWKEIEENLLPNQSVEDRPDLVARIFSLKVNRLIKSIVHRKCFGEVKSYVYVIEFQKRGLPHIHLLVILAANSKLLTPETVDLYISAEIPDEAVNPTLHNIIMSNNIHGPCGDWCLVDGKCSKHFPKTLQEETTLEDNCYVSYRRANTGRNYQKPNGYIIDNSFVVSYCPKLSQEFNCHINVEVVSSIKSVKYIYKYIYKGHDAASIIITDSNGESSVAYNEISHYEENRYVGPVEAAWRILSKNLSKMSHTVYRLPVHLPGEQNMYIRQGLGEGQISYNLEKNTKLLDYFHLNKRDVFACQYLYNEIPEYYVWEQKTCRWKKRVRKEKIIGRMYSVSPSDVELFHLRLLLLTVKGAASFESLRTVNGVICKTFTSACLALGLIAHDHEWKTTLEEASLWMMPQSLRQLFVSILIYCNPIEPGELWYQFKSHMCEDYSRAVDSNLAEKKAFRNIVELLFKEGYHLDDFPDLPKMEDESEMLTTDNYININYEKMLGTERYDNLNIKQKDVVDYVLNAVDDSGKNCCKCIYVDGPGGSGKTFMYITLWHLLRSMGKTVCNMAFTGIAATLLPEGRTVHKVMGLPVPLYNDSSSSIKVQSKDGLYLKNVDVFIWDEAPMAPKYALEIMDRTLRDIMKTDIPFGGKTIVLGGDFRQVLPIKEKGTRSEIINLSIKNSKLWNYFAKFTLSENMRALPEETEFIDFLLNIGNGTINDVNDFVNLPEKIIKQGYEDIVEDVYGDLIRNKKFDELASHTILAPRNVDVDEINKRVVELLDIDKHKVYKSIDSIDDRDTINDHEVILPEYLNTLSPAGLPPHELSLRIHSVVMLIRNISINEGLCNGTRLLVLDLSNHVIKCKILSGDKSCHIAFAMTVNKAQGQTFKKIAIDLRKDVFNHGQLYVALSRVRSFDAVKVYLGSQRSRNRIKNYVYKEIFQ